MEKKGDKYQITEDCVFSTNDIPSKAIKNFHHAMLEKAKDALEEQDVTERDIQGMTIALAPDDIDDFKKRYKKFSKTINKNMGIKKEQFFIISNQLFFSHRKY